MHQKLITIEDASQILNVKNKTLYNWFKAGILPGYRFGTGKRKLIRFDIEMILDFLEKSATKNTKLNLDQEWKEIETILEKKNQPSADSRRGDSR